MRTAILSSVLVSSLLMGACGGQEENDEPLTLDEAEQAVESANLASSAQSVTYDVVEISTHFTLGQGVVKAAAELKLFAASQVPCATVTADSGQVTIDFGTLSDGCTFRGRNYAGVAIIAVERAEGELLVHHRYENLTNGHVTVNGEADVTWSRASHARHVTYDLEFTHEDFDATFTAAGDVTQTLLDPAAGLSGGIEIAGQRTLERDDGRTWTLDIDGVEVRGMDPVPQAGGYELTTPNGKRVTLSFERISPTTIRVTLVGPRGRTRQVDVLSLD